MARTKAKVKAAPSGSVDNTPSGSKTRNQLPQNVDKTPLSTLSNSPRTPRISKQKSKENKPQKGTPKLIPSTPLDVERTEAAELQPLATRTLPTSSFNGSSSSSSQEWNQTGSQASSRQQKSIRKKFKPHKITALQDINRLQRTTGLLIPKLSFMRVVKEILQNFLPNDHIRISSSALMALHESAEMYIVQLFEDANDCAKHARRVTLQVNDIHLTRKIRGIGDIINR